MTSSGPSSNSSRRPARNPIEQLLAVQVGQGVADVEHDPRFVPQDVDVGVDEAPPQILRRPPVDERKLEAVERLAIVELLSYPDQGGEREHLADLRLVREPVVDLLDALDLEIGEPVPGLLAFGFRVVLGRFRGRLVVEDAILVQIENDLQRGGAAELAVDEREPPVDLGVLAEVVDEAVLDGEPGCAERADREQRARGGEHPSPVPLGGERQAAGEPVLGTGPFGRAGPSEQQHDGGKQGEGRVTNVTPSPMLIIQPKSMTGLMPLNTSEPKPMMVVSAV